MDKHRPTAEFLPARCAYVEFVNCVSMKAKNFIMNSLYDVIIALWLYFILIHGYGYSVLLITITSSLSVVLEVRLFSFGTKS